MKYIDNANKTKAKAQESMCLEYILKKTSNTFQINEQQQA